jgi:hypothetical protein
LKGCFGSFSDFGGRDRDVRFPPVSDRTADITGGPFRAKSVRKVFQALRLQDGSMCDAFQIAPHFDGARFQGLDRFQRRKPEIVFMIELSALAIRPPLIQINGACRSRVVLFE